MQQQIKTIIFDFDGTLVDSERFYFDCMKQTLYGFNILFEENKYYLKYAGIPTKKQAEMLCIEYDIPVSSLELVNKIEHVIQISLATQIPKLMPHADTSLKYYYEKGMKLGIVTGSPLSSVNHFFANTDYKRFFDFVVTRDDVENSKPDSECYLLAIEKSNAEKDKTIVFEDTQTGITAAKGAELTCFAIQKNKLLHPKLIQANSIFHNLKDAQKYITQHYQFINY